MQAYDVIIIGAGPAGLKCAEVLGGTGMRVLLLEKKDVPGDKLCAGGLTLKGLEVLPLPDSVVEHRISRAILHSRNRRAVTDTPYHFLFTINRKELAAWQKSLLDGSGVVIRMNSQVTAINDDRVVLKDGRE